MRILLLGALLALSGECGLLLGGELGVEAGGGLAAGGDGLARSEQGVLLVLDHEHAVGGDGALEGDGGDAEHFGFDLERVCVLFLRWKIPAREILFHAFIKNQCNAFLKQLVSSRSICFKVTRSVPSCCGDFFSDSLTKEEKETKIQKQDTDSFHHHHHFSLTFHPEL